MDKKKLMWSSLVVIVFASLLGCIYIYSYGLFGVRGVYYEPIDDSILETMVPPDTSGCFAGYWLGYDGRVYTGYGEYYVEDINEEKVIYLSDVYSYHAFSSVAPEVLGGEMWEGKLYALEGYDVERTVGIYYEQWNILRIYHCINDIWLKTGKDLFYDIYHVEEAEFTILCGSDLEKEYVLEVDEALWFIKELYKGKFVEKTEEIEKNTSNIVCMVVMVDKQRISRRAYITEDGYLRILICGDEYLLMVTDEMMGKLKEYDGR